MGKFTDNSAFKQLLDERKQDILQRTNDGVQGTEQFQRLLSLLSESRRKFEESDFRLVLISKIDLANLCEDSDVKVAELFKELAFLNNRTVYVDSSLTIQNCNNDFFPADNNEARRFFASLSATEDNWVVFHIAPNATVNYFIGGRDYGDGIFYTIDAQNSYEELKTIEHLQEVLDEYQVHLTHQDTYLKFFVTKAGLRALHDIAFKEMNEDVFMTRYHHLLNNKPEELFREDLRNFIIQHMKVVVSREVLLENLNRMDIKFTDEKGNDLYLIEVKWVGESIHSSGQKLGIGYKASPMIHPNAVKQVVCYIDELLKEKENIKIGYLAVFDARKEDLPDTGADITSADVPEELRKHFHRFVKLRDFRVKNENPR